MNKMTFNYERPTMSQEKKPVVAITIGDPAGIGPEITVATMMDKSVYDPLSPGR